MNLNGEWDFRDQSGEYQLAISFPVDAISALYDAGLIADPYWGRNEYDLRWIAERDWAAKRSFELTSTKAELVLSGLDTVVDVYVNGTQVLEARNSFRTYRVDLGEVGKIGENSIELRFNSSVVEAAALQKAEPYFVPFSGDNCPIPNGNMLRKAQCDFGWDWNIALAPFGVLGGICIEPKAELRIDAVLVDQTHRDGAVDVQVEVLFEAQTSGVSDLTVELCGQRMTTKVEHLSGSGRGSGVLTIENPDLWWPAGCGAQTLHQLSVTLGEATEHRRIGLRAIDLVVEEDTAGAGFKFQVNGRDIFAKGANWIPADALSGRISQDGVRDLLQSAVDANMNMVRIWGGGRYEPTWFYDLCDEMGLMVWQDFMFACMMYSATDRFLAEVHDEIVENVKRMNHHACLALWCGDNEVIGALTWFPESRDNRDRYLVAYDRLNRVIEQGLKEVSPNANWWPSSPSSGLLNFGDAWHDDSSGDMHFWSVWHEGRDFEHYRDVNPRFCSEFGFQSYPSLDVIRSFVSPEDMNIAAPVFESHQKNKGGNARIAETMFRYFRFPVDFENFVYLSQVQQGLAIKTAVSYWRSLKPHCMGTLIWQLNDTWPVASWSSLDYGGGWKLMHHMAQSFYQPVFATVVPDGDDLIVKAINDMPRDVEVRLDVFATNMAGAKRVLGSATETIGPDAAKETLWLRASELAEDEILTFTWTGSDGTTASDFFAPKPFKSYDLLPAQLSCEISQIADGFAIDLSAKALALFVSVESDCPGRFSQNAITVAPGDTIQIKFTPNDTGSKPNFTIRDLHSATYGA